MYDLGIDESDSDEGDAGNHVQKDSDARTEELPETSVPGGGVKVLSEKTGLDDNFQNDILDSELVPVKVGNLADEFRGLLQMN